MQFFSFCLLTQRELFLLGAASFQLLSVGSAASLSSVLLSALSTDSHSPASLTVISLRWSPLFALHRLQEGPWCWPLLPLLLLVCRLWWWTVRAYLVMLLLLLWLAELVVLFGFYLFGGFLWFPTPPSSSFGGILCRARDEGLVWVNHPLPDSWYLPVICPSSACLPGGGIAYSHCVLWDNLRIYLR